MHQPNRCASRGALRLLCWVLAVGTAAGGGAIAHPSGSGKASVRRSVDAVGVPDDGSTTKVNDAPLTVDASILVDAGALFLNKLDVLCDVLASAIGLDRGRRNQRTENNAEVAVNANAELRDLTLSMPLGLFPYRTDFAATAEAVGIGARDGRDVTTLNQGTLNVSASTILLSGGAPVHFAPTGYGDAELEYAAAARAGGVVVDNRTDCVQNAGSIQASAMSTAGAPALSVSGQDHPDFDLRIAGTADAAGIDAGRGLTAENSGWISAGAMASVDASGSPMDLLLTTASSAEVEYTAGAAAAGARLGECGGSFTNSGGLSASASSQVGGPGLSVAAAPQGSRCYWEAGSLDAEFRSTASAAGIDAGTATLSLNNTGWLDASAMAGLSTGWDPLQVELARGMRSDLLYVAEAEGFGAVFGRGSVVNGGGISGSALANAAGPEVFLSSTLGGGGDEGGNVATTAGAVAAGLVAQRSTTTVNNSAAGSIEASAHGNAGGSGATLSAGSGGGSAVHVDADQVVAGATVTGTATAAGVQAQYSSGRVTYWGEGSVSASANAAASQGNVSLGLSRLALDTDCDVTSPGDVRVTAATSAAGVTARGTADVAAAGAVSARASASASMGDLGVTLDGVSVGSPPAHGGCHGTSRCHEECDEAALVVVDAATAAAASAVGIEGGYSSGVLSSTGGAGVQAMADAGGGSVDLTVESGAPYLEAGTVLVRAGREASADAVVLRGQGDDDDLASAGDVWVSALATANQPAVNIEVAGSVSQSTRETGAALFDVTAASAASAIGLSGGQGDDTLASEGSVNASAYASVASGYVPQTIHVDSTGDVTTPRLADSSVRAESFAAGLDGGSGGDEITSSAAITVSAYADAGHAGTNLVNDGDLDAGGPCSPGILATASATAEAVGIRGGTGSSGRCGSGSDGDVITSTGDLSVSAYAAAQVGPTAVTVAGSPAAVAGVVDNSAAAEATATGISAGGDDPWVLAGGSLGVTATAGAQSGGGSGPAAATATAQGVATDGSTNTVSLNALSALTVAAEATGNTAAAEAAGVLVNDRSGSGQSWDSAVNLDGTIDVTATTHGGGGSEAIAYGIRVDGSGRTFVDNRGSITAIALADAGTAAAIGIRTGSGADLVQNRGQVTAMAGGEAGVAIDTGAGDDRVILADGSQTTGQVLMGAGADRLTVVGSATVTTADGDRLARGGSGTDTLVLEGYAGTQFLDSSNYDGFERFVKQGAGTTQLTNFNRLPSLTVSRGTLELDGAYEFATDGTTTVALGSGGGLLRIDEAANLGGTLAIERGGGAFLNGATFDVLQAGSIVEGSSFSQTVLPDATPLLRFSLQQNGSSFQATTHTNPFTTVSCGDVQSAVARWLDEVTPQATGDLADLIGDFQAASAAGHARAFSSMGPETYEGSALAAMEVARCSSGVAEQRLYALRRSLRGSARVLSGQGSAGSGSPQALALVGAQFAGRSGAPGAWAAQHSGSTRGAAPSGFTGALSTTTGTQMGFDTQVGSLLVGAAAGSSTSWLDLDGSAGSGTLSGAGGSLYGTGLVGRYYLQGVLAYSAHTNRSFRRLVVGDAQRIAGSTHDGAVFSAAFGAGRTLNRGGWSVNPSVCVRYARLGEEGFAESGAGGASLVVHDRLAQTLAAEVGVRLDRAYSLGRGSLIPEVSAAWGYDLGLTGQGLTAAFAGAPGETVSLPGGTAPRHRFTLGAGLGFVHPGGVSFSLRYNPQLVSDYRPDHVGWGAAMQFAFR